MDTKNKLVWVVSSNSHKVVVFKQNGDFVREITGSLFFPCDVAVDPKNGNVHVVSPFSAQVSLVPVLVGGGVRLFEHLGADAIALEQTRVIESDSVTHLRYRVVHD